MSIQAQRSEQALLHLKRLKPYDGWAIDTYTSIQNETKTMLKRRNIPLSKKGFDCIVYDSHDSKCVIGITSSIGDTENSEFCRGVVLVDKHGNVVRDEKVVRIMLKKIDSSTTATTTNDAGKKEWDYKEMMNSKVKNLNAAREAIQQRQRTQTTRTSSFNSSDDTTKPILPNISEEQTSELARLGLMAIGGITVMRIFSAMFFSVYIFVIPLVILYAMADCPTLDSFDAKKELKRVLRG